MKKNEYGRLEMSPLPPVTKAKLVVIGEYPNITELRAGQYFISDGAIALRNTLSNEGINLDECYFTVAVPYLMSKNKIIPVYRSLKERQRLINEIKESGAHIVMPLGAFASALLLGRKSLTMKSILGNSLDIPELPGVTIIPNYHPAALIHAPGNYKVFKGVITLVSLAFNGTTLNPGKTTWQWVESRERIQDLITKLEQKPYTSCDIEASSLNRQTNTVWVIGICFEKNNVHVISMEAFYNNIDLMLQMFDLKVRWIWHNGKFDTAMLQWKGIKTARIDEDTIYQHYSLNETNGTHGLGTCATMYLGADEYKSKMNSEFANITRVEDYLLKKQELGERVAIDADYTFQLYEVFTPMLEEHPELVDLYKKILIPAANFLRKVEMRGVKVDVPYLESRVPFYEAQIAEIVERVQKAAEPFWDPDVYKAQTGAKSASALFKPTSVKQLAWLIYDKLRLKPKHKMAKKRGTGEEILESIENPPQFIAEILVLRKVQKEYSTYVKSYLDSRDHEDLLHATFNLHVTATGRLSCVEPNLQNVPSGKPDIRNSLIPRAKNRVLMEVDYSGAELRVLAFVSGDENLTKALTDGDPHTEVAIAVYGDTFINADSTTKKLLRGNAKTVNFGIAYGRQAPNLAETFGITLAEAQHFIDTWAAMYPKAWEYLQSCEEHVRKGEDLITLYGRHRRVGLVHDANVQDLINEAKNFRIQSISSDNTLLAAMQMDATLENDYDAYIINLVHDSILIDCPANPEIVREVAHFARSTMINLPKQLYDCNVPFKSDVDIGPSWGTFAAYDIDTETVDYKGTVYPYVSWITSKGVLID